MDPSTILSRNAWFAAQTTAVRAALIRCGRVVQFERGSWVYGTGDDQTGLCAVLSGALRIEAAWDDRMVLIDIAQPSDVIGQSARSGGGPRLVTARAHVRSTVLLISERALVTVADTVAGVDAAITGLIYAHLRTSIQAIAMLLLLPPRERVLVRAKMFVRQGKLAIGQSDLAEMTGLSRKTINAHLADLERDGLLPQRPRSKRNIV